MNDSHLDGLRFDSEEGSWRSTRSVHLFGRDWEVELLVDGDRQSPSPIPSATLKSFVNFQDRILSRAESALLEYYLRIAPDLRRQFGPASARESVPAISTVFELPRVLTPKTLCISEVDPPQTFCLLLDCTWDLSHGVGVRFVGDAVDLVGAQEEML